MSEKTGKQYLVLFSLDPSTPNRLRGTMPLLTKTLERLSTEPIELFFRSLGADHFGYLIRSKIVPGQILAVIESPERGFVGLRMNDPPFLTKTDSVAVIELGTEAADRGFGRATTWMQRH